MYACFCEGDHDTLPPSQWCEPCRQNATRFDVLVEYVNGQTTWVTMIADDAEMAWQRALDSHENAVEASIHAWGTRPGERRQGR